MKNIIFLFLLIPAIGFSQRRKVEKDTSDLISQLGRIEFQRDNLKSNFYIVEGEEDGILVAQDTQNRLQGGAEWKIYLVDSTLSLVWSESCIIPAQGSLLGYEYSNGDFFLLFNKDTYRSENLIIYQFSTESKNYLTYELSTVFPVELTHFESVGNSLLFAGYANYRPVVITYDLDTKLPRVVPGFYDNRNDILDLIVDDEASLFSIISSERMKNRKFTVSIKSYTANGDLVQTNMVNPGEKMSILDAASTKFSNGLQYLAGTYSKKKSLQYSQGFYLSKFINGTQQLNQYYAFADLSNFFDHLKERREERIVSRIDRKKERGKTKKFNYRLLVHEIIEQGGEYIMIAESYYPRYDYSATSAFSTFGRLGRSSQAANPYFLGYKFTHAVVVGFDKNCNILWDHTFKIDDILSYSLEENVVVSADEEKVVLSYLENNEIRSKVVNGEEIIEGKTFSPVRLSFDTDQLQNRYSDVEGLKRWYGNTLFAYGEQSIKNANAIAGKTSRKVFYINKIRYDSKKLLN
ncbi:MAG: hypothetical protein AB8B73_08745 [Ekhidna sp.]